MTLPVRNDDTNVIEARNPYALMERAVANGASIETLERLMALQERYEASEARKAFFKAMQEFQMIKPILPKSQEVTFGNGKAAYKFCPLDVIEENLRAPLDQTGLAYRFANLRGENGEIGIRCIVSHVLGHIEHTDMYAPADTSGNKNSIQSIGSTTTYLKRYALSSALGLVTADEDDDGEATGDRPYTLLILHNQTVRENYQVICAIKDALAEDDYMQVCEYFEHMDERVKSQLWLAPTKGGIFSTEERAKLKSNECAAARNEYYAKKQTQA